MYVVVYTVYRYIAGCTTCSTSTGHPLDGLWDHVLRAVRMDCTNSPAGCPRLRMAIWPYKDAGLRTTRLGFSARVHLWSMD